MSLNRSSVSYRVKKSRVGKKLKNHTHLLFLIAIALVTVILTVIWGLIWGEQAQASAMARAEADAAAAARAADTPEWLPTQPEEIEAAYLGHVTTLNAAISSAQSLLAEGTHALSVPLYTDGTPFYDSAVAQTMGRQASGATDVSLTRLFAAILASDGYVSATFTCSWQSIPETDVGLRRTLRAYEGALAAEIAQSGASEVLLLGLDPDTASISEIVSFLRELRADCPEAIVGVAVPTTVMLDDNHIETVRALLTWTDFVALDLSDYANHTVRTTDEEGNVKQSAATLEQVLDLLAPSISRYRMRLLIPTSMYEMLEQIEELGYENWQIIR